MKPIRRKKSVKITEGRTPGQDRVHEMQSEEDVLCGGSVDTTNVHRVFPCDCGCLQPPAGRCVLCGALSCGACHGHCMGCNAPICRECSVFVNMPEESAARFCQGCYSTIKRQKRRASILRFVLFPLVKFGGRGNE